MNLQTLRELHPDDTLFAKAIIEECLFAFLLFYNGKIDPIAAEEMLYEHFEMEKNG